MTGAEDVRVRDAWWCDEHEAIHEGEITSWSMEHRKSLHPLYAHRRNLT